MNDDLSPAPILLLGGMLLLLGLMEVGAVFAAFMT